MNVFRSFGKNPSGIELEKFKRSLNYRNGIFNNLQVTNIMSKEGSLWKTTFDFINKPKNTAPAKELPSVKTDLKSLHSKEPVIIWFGHSSYLIHIDGINILVDPVFSGYASPFSFGARSFAGSDVYSVEDMPVIDILIITHDHYDHLDHRTIALLKNKTKQLYTSLGVAAHLISWGVDKNIIQELDWWDTKQINGITITAAPARHFSGRSIARFKTLWSSFILDTGIYKIYIGADSGYDTVFRSIGEKYGPFDIAMLESGQYNLLWPNIHMMPEETVQASIDLKARILMPVHWGKFALALHPWDEPIRRVITKALEVNVQTTTPLIGEPVIINNAYPNTKWWEL